jgi:hypothetical protein
MLSGKSKLLHALEMLRGSKKTRNHFSGRFDTTVSCIRPDAVSVLEDGNLYQPSDSKKSRQTPNSE